MVKLCNNFIKKWVFSRKSEVIFWLETGVLKSWQILWTILEIEEQIKIWKWEMIVWIQLIVVESLTLFLEFRNRGYF